MADLNRVILAGNLTRDPELRYTSSGTAVADLGFAVNDRYKNKAGEWVEKACFVEVVVWGRQAETCGEYLTKGSPALVEGKLQYDTWESQQGEKRSKLLVRADRVQFMGGPPRQGEPGDAPARSETPSAPEAGSQEEAPPDFGGGDSENLPF